jgi:translation elongation factor EF-1beta
MLLTILKKFKAKVIELPKESELTQEIATALNQVKQIQSGEIESLSLKDI